MRTPMEQAASFTLDRLRERPRVTVRGLGVVCVHRDVLSERVEVEMEGGLTITIPREVVDAAVMNPQDANEVFIDYIVSVLQVRPIADESCRAPEVLQDEDPVWSPDLVPEVWRW